MNNNLAFDLAIASAKQFDLVKEKFGLTYEKDFDSFSKGYVLGIMSALKPEQNKND